MAPKYPRAIVGGLVYNSKNEILLVQSAGKFKGQWIAAGGKVEWGETVVHAFEREIREETNLKLKDIKFLGIAELIEQDRHFIFLQHSARALNENEVKLNEEATDFGWFNHETMKKLRIAPATVELIKRHYR